jgi:hypothetical protein
MAKWGEGDMSGMIYQMELLARDRQERLLREADETRLHRLVGGRPRTPARPERRRLFSRS